MKLQHIEKSIIFLKCPLLSIDDIAFGFVAMHYGIGRGIRQNKMS